MTSDQDPGPKGPGHRPESEPGVADSDRARLEELITPLLGPAYGFCLRLTRSGPDAEDLVQEAALSACKGFATFERGTNFKAWFFKIIVNTLRSRFRRKRPEHYAVPFDDAPDLFLFKRTADLGWHREGSNPARQLLDRLDTSQIEMALADLPQKYREVCMMYFIEDFSYEEIAKMLGIRLGTVRSRLHRGRKLLQRSLWRVAVEHGIVPADGMKGDPGHD
jgi:RNA polymerase sigma-70 factor (ECF subfamily)